MHIKLKRKISIFFNANIILFANHISYFPFGNMLDTEKFIPNLVQFNQILTVIIV